MEYLILDTETTGLGPDAEIVEICIIDNNANVLINQRIDPVNPIPEIATKIHGITNNDVINCPNWDQVYYHVMELLLNYKVFIYKAEYDLRLIKQSTEKYDYLCHQQWNRYLPDINYDCVMKASQKYLNKPIGKHLPLAKACEFLGINFDPFKNHSAHYDCVKTLEIIKSITGD